MPDDQCVLILCRDLLLQSKVTATAREMGIATATIREPASLGARPGRLLIADLNQPGAIDAAAMWRGATGRTAVGFVSHVDAATAAAAKAAGVDRVIARSAFVMQLAEILRAGSSA
jgi:hypothetical protein